MDRMDDDSPESEETHEAAVERVEEASIADAEVRQAESAVETPRLEQAEPPRVEAQSEPQPVEAHPKPSQVEAPHETPHDPTHVAASSPPAEPAPAPPAAPDHADRDPQ